MAQNYQQIFNSIIGSLQGKPRLLLHTCCAPCSTSVLENLADKFEITLLYFNPNTYPQSEYDSRLAELRAFLKAAGLDKKIPVLENGYDHDLFISTVTGLENEKEGAKRCYECYKLRLAETMRQGILNRFDYFCTVLSISPHKNAEWINHLGLEMAENQPIKFLPADFKKANGYLRSLELSREYNLYRQNYCGCEFSVRG